MTREEKYNAFVEDDLKNNCGRLLNCCEELDYLLSHPRSNMIFSKHHLNEITTYAATFSPFYKQLGIKTDLKDFPIVNKQFYKDHWDEILVKDYQGQIGTIEKFTSGSTGTPFKMVMDRYKHCRWIAANKVFRSNVGVRSHEKTVFISETVADKSIPAERMERDNVYYLRCCYFDDKSISSLIDYLTENDVRTMTALASILERIAHWIVDAKAPKWSGNFIAIFSVSEHLKDNVRKIISDYFNCPVYVLYANEENGVLGVEDGSKNGCRANEADFYFEVLKMDSNNPADEGELGRLVITDFFNKAFPIIRYENGDLVSYRRNKEGKLYFEEIAGRLIDALYTTDGRMVNYFEAISFLEVYMDIKQFQLVQYDHNKYKWVLNTNNHSYEKMIESEGKKVFGEDSYWTFEYVDELPKLKSGKVRMTVNLMNEKKL